MMLRAFYTEKGLDILKDAVNVPEVSLHYLLPESVERGAELYNPSKEAYEMLKGAVVGGPSIVFTRYHKVGITKIRPHQKAKPCVCKRILPYDACSEKCPAGREELFTTRVRMRWERR